MTIESFEDITAWKKSKDITVRIYDKLESSKDFGFKDQIQRCAVSVMNNIAEGFERQSDKDFKRFLYIAKGSCGELRSMLSLGKELNYFSNDDYKKLYSDTVEVSRMLSGFINELDWLLTFNFKL